MSARIAAGPINDSVFAELTRNFYATYRAARKVLGDRHLMATLCLHASGFPSDRMSARLVWEQFNTLPLSQKTDVLQALRSGAQ